MLDTRPLASWMVAAAPADGLAAAYSEVVAHLRALPKGSVIVLLGELGAGKTQLVRLLVAALGSSAQVSSPSYTLMQVYPSPLGDIVHVDAYKYLQDSSHPLAADPLAAESLLGLGLEDYLEHAHLVLIEWGAALLPYLEQAQVLTFHQHHDGSRQLMLYPGDSVRAALTSPSASS